MPASNHRIIFHPASPGAPGAQPLNNFIGTDVTCPVCHASVPITAADIAAHRSASGQPDPTAVFRVEVLHGTGSIPDHGTGPIPDHGTGP